MMRMRSMSGFFSFVRYHCLGGAWWKAGLAFGPFHSWVQIRCIADILCTERNGWASRPLQPKSVTTKHIVVFVRSKWRRMPFSDSRSPSANAPVMNALPGQKGTRMSACEHLSRFWLESPHSHAHMNRGLLGHGDFASLSRHAATTTLTVSIERSAYFRPLSSIQLPMLKGFDVLIIISTGNERL